MMDPNIGIAIVTFSTAVLTQCLRSGWAAYKRKFEGKEIPLKLHKGVYVPDDHITRVERWIKRIGNVLGVWALLMLCFIIYLIATGQ